MEVKRRTARALISKLGSISTTTRATALCELRILTKNDPNIRPIIAEEGAIAFLSETLYSTSPSDQENAAFTLLNLSISCPEAIISSSGLLDALSHVLSNHMRHPPASVQAASSTVYSLSIHEILRPAIGSKRDIINALIDIVRSKQSPAESMRDSLKALFGISLCVLNRGPMLDLKAAEVLFGVVLRDDRVGIVEDSTAVIAQIAGCEKSVEAFRRVSGIRVLVDLIHPDTVWSDKIRKNAVSGLLKLANFGGLMVVEEIRELGCGFVFHGLNNMANNGSIRVRQKATALIDILNGVNLQGLEPSLGEESNMGSDSNSCSH